MIKVIGGPAAGIEMKTEGKLESSYWIRGVYYVKCSDSKYRPAGDAAKFTKRNRKQQGLFDELTDT